MWAAAEPWERTHGRPKARQPGENTLRHESPSLVVVDRRRERDLGVVRRGAGCRRATSWRRSITHRPGSSWGVSRGTEGAASDPHEGETDPRGSADLSDEGARTSGAVRESGAAVVRATDKGVGSAASGAVLALRSGYRE